MPERFSKFVQNENIARFSAQLAIEPDPIKRALLIKLLAEARANTLPHPGPEGSDKP